MAKKHCRILDNSDDDILKSFISAARDYAEAVTGRKLPKQTITAVCDEFPSTNEIVLPVGPVISVASLEYTDKNGTTTAFSDFSLDNFSLPGKIVLNPDVEWPSGISLHPVNPIKIVYEAGYESADDINFRVKQAMLLLIGHYYEHREETITGVETFSVPEGADALLNTIRHTTT